jgi:hypothetical protein
MTLAWTSARDDYLRQLAARGLRRSSLATLTGRLDTLLGDLHALGCLTPTDVKPADLDAVILAGRERGLSRETLRGWAGTLRSF